MKGRGWLWLIVLTWSAGASTRARSDRLESGVLGEADGVDELELARVAAEAGDARLKDALDDPTQREVAALAARAAPYAHAPELLVPALAKLACGRDPALAPEAGHALWQLAERLRPSQLGADEVLRRDLEQASLALQCREHAPVPRADIVVELAQLRAALDALLR